MKNIFIIRHGESLANRNVKAYKKFKDSKIPLSKKGVNQAIKVGLFLSTFFKSTEYEKDTFNFYYSPYIRAKNTGKFILNNLFSEIDIKSINSEKLLIEQDFALDGLNSYKKINQKMMGHIDSINKNGYYNAKSDGGESPSEVVERIKPFVDKILNLNIDNVIIVAHGTSCRAIVHCLMNRKPEEFEHNPKNASVKMLSCRGTKFLDKGYIYTP